jgi:uncharacterized protein
VKALEVSRYLTVSERSYEDAAGHRVKLVLGGRTGHFMAVPEAVGLSLARGVVPSDLNGLADALTDAEILVAGGEDELRSLTERNQRAADDEASLSFGLLPTANCNMGCAYCGQTHGGRMTPDRERAIIDRVTARIRRGSTRQVQVTWFGAEPMMGYPSLIRMSRALTREADEAGIAYTAKLITNGSLLTPENIVELYQVGRVAHLEITLDGPPEVHDAHRPLRGGGGSFHHITNAVRDALRGPGLEEIFVRFRTNVDVHNVEHVEEYLRCMRRLGFDDPRVDFDLHPVHRWSNDVSAIELPHSLYAAYETRWLITMLELGLNFVAIPTGSKKVVCKAVTRVSEMISNTGAVFSCSEHPLVPKHERDDAVGSVFDDPSTNRAPGRFAGFNQLIAEKRVPCGECPFLGVCGGACPKHWSEGVAPCPPYKYNIQARLDVAGALNRLRLL